MSLNKKRMVREIGRRTRLSNRDVERVIETLVDVWTEELVSGGRIEIEHFMVLKVKTIHRDKNSGKVSAHEPIISSPRVVKRVLLRSSKALRTKLENDS